MSLLNQGNNTESTEDKHEVAMGAGGEILEGAVLETLDAEELLELDISQLADVEAFKLLPNGLYGWSVKSVGLEEIGDEGAKAIEVIYTIHECIELLDQADEDAVGELPREYKELYFLKGGKGFGIRTFSTIFRPVAEQTGATRVADLMENIVGVTGSSFIKLRNYVHKGTQEKRQSNNIDATTVELA